MHALGKDRVARACARNDPKWLDKAVAEAFAARKGAAQTAARKRRDDAKRTKVQKPGPAFALSGGRLDSYYATLGIPPDAYVHKY